MTNEELFWLGFSSRLTDELEKNAAFKSTLKSLLKKPPKPKIKASGSMGASKADPAEQYLNQLLRSGYKETPVRTKAYSYAVRKHKPTI